MYIDVYLNVANTAVSRPFAYAVPEELSKLAVKGARVIAPLRGKDTEGYIVRAYNEGETPDYDIKKIKPISDIPDEPPMFTETTLALALWLSEEYDTPAAACFSTVMPAGAHMVDSFAAEPITNYEAEARLRGGAKRVYEFLRETGGAGEVTIKEMFGQPGVAAVSRLSDLGLALIVRDLTAKDYIRRVKWVFLGEGEDFDKQAEAVLNEGGKQADVLSYLFNRGDAALADIRRALGISASPVNTLVARGLIRVETVTQKRDVLSEIISGASHIEKPVIIYTREQQAAIDTLIEELDNPEKKPYLIHGVTGSGKTEVYLKLIEEVIGRGKQAIMLVPEIALTPQAAANFAKRFGGAVTLTHSRQTYAERYDQWRKARAGEVSVMIGPRSAIFAPFSDIGIIVIDEEHEHTYQSEISPKYHVLAVANKIAALTGCMVIYGSATPSVGTYFAAVNGDIGLCELKNRVNLRPPAVFVEDMREELARGNRSIFSAALKKALSDTVGQGKQAILFMNRRGHSTFVSCRVCGYTCHCGNCSVNYTYHAYNNKMICHYCGVVENPPEKCPACGSDKIRYFGAGTQKIEEDVAALLPNARVLRMDMDTTRRKNGHAKIINAFAAGEADILVGTQMIAKGLDFPNVALVGVVAADTALNTGDYASAEAAFQLITQVAGRAGRADTPGTVIIQTYQPEHYAIEFAKTQDYCAFYKSEIAIRSMQVYPPYTHVLMALAQSGDEKRLIAALNTLKDIMERYNRKGDFYLLGPAPCVISKIRGMYRWKMLVKCEDAKCLRAYVKYCVEKLASIMDTAYISWNITLDPMTIQ